MNSELTILFWLWRSPTCKEQYTPERVDMAAKMIDRNLTLPHRFVCATDWPLDSFGPLIEPIPLWDDWRELQNPKWGPQKPHCYVRLKAFSREAGELIGPRFVSIDLDCLVLDCLDPLFSRTEDFLIFHRFIDAQRPRIVNNPYNGSMWMMTAGARAQVWQDFNGEQSVLQALGHIGTDQAWITHKLGREEAGWDYRDGVFGWPNIQGDGRYEKEPPPGARLIFFYGEEKPWHYLKDPPAPASLPYNHRESRRRNRIWQEPPRFQWIRRYYK